MTANTVCVVGGGPAGVVLSYLLARRGVEVTLLEAQKDLDRDFRGDTLHYAVMENLAQMGVADALLEQTPHSKMRQIFVEINGQPRPFVDFSRIKTPYPFVTVMAQSDFLSFMVEQMAAFPNFTLRMRTRADDLIIEHGRVCGVKTRSGSVKGEIRADLIVACDGRASKLRRLAGLVPEPLTEPLDVLWLRVRRKADDNMQQLAGGFAGGTTPIVIIERTDHYQLGIVLPHGRFSDVKAAGLPALQKRILAGVPQFADRIHEIDDWRKVSFLQVTGSRLASWNKDGMLLIGDAAHVMNPLGGVGINYAIHDAIEAANVLVAPLLNGNVTDLHLTEIQRRRERPTRLIQLMQSQGQKRLIDPSRGADVPFEFPAIMGLIARIPWLRDIPARFVGGGLGRVQVQC